MKRFDTRGILLLGIVLMIASLPGCGGASNDHAEEVEHTRPDHWPNTFIDAVADIEDRFDQREAGSLSEEGLAELRDLLKWLPDIAGDTSLDEANWTLAVAAGRELEAALGGEADVPEANVSDAIATLTEVSVLTAEDSPPYVPGRHEADSASEVAGEAVSAGNGANAKLGDEKLGDEKLGDEKLGDEKLGDAEVASDVGAETEAAETDESEVKRESESTP